MQKLISKYGLAAHLALLSVAPLFLFSFCGAWQTGIALVWLSLTGAIWLFLEPSRRNGEMLHQARVRVARAVFSDPLFWLFVVLSAFAALRWANGGVALAYDAAEGRWSIARPSMPWFPGHASGEGFLQFAAVLALAVVVEGCRHALGKSARTSYLFTSSFLAGIAAVAVTWAARGGVQGAVDAMDNSVLSPSFAGCAFGLHALGGIVALAGMLECKWNKALLLFSFAAGAPAAGLFYTAPTAVTLAFAAVALVVAVGSSVYLWFSLRPPDVLKFVVGLFIAAAVPVFLAVCVVPQAFTDARLAFFRGDGLFPDGFWEMRARLSEIAKAAWSGNLWGGSGIGAFPLEARFAATDADWQAWSAGVPKGALNGWWLLLAERGIFGVVAIAVPFCFMVYSFVRRLVGAIGRHSFLPLCGLGPVAVAVVAAEAAIDASFLRPEALLALGAFFALSASAFPPPRRDAGNEGEQAA